MPDKSTGVCAARTNALVCHIHNLIIELEERIEDGEPFDNPKLTRTAERVFGGSRAQGRYTPRDAYDAVEIAVNNYLLEKHARELMQMDVTEALASVLRPIDAATTATNGSNVGADRATTILDTADACLRRRAAT